MRAQVNPMLRILVARVLARLGFLQPLRHRLHHERLDLGFLGVLLIAASIGLPLLRLSSSLYLWLSVLFLSAWGMPGSTPRFDLVVFPLFIVMAILGTRSYAFHVGYLLIASMVAALFMILHSQWNWVA